MDFFLSLNKIFFLKKTFSYRAFSVDLRQKFSSLRIL